MARFMTLPFKWHQKEYTAFVTVKSIQGDVFYNIAFKDADLSAIIPEGQLSFYGSEGAELLDRYMSSASRDLINVIVSELVAKHS